MFTKEDIAFEQSEIQSKKDIYAFFEREFNKGKQKLIGIEHERFIYDISSNTPVRADLNVIKEIIARLECLGWVPILDPNGFPDLVKGQEMISFEAGGQIEYSGKPCQTVEEIMEKLFENIHMTKKILPKNHILSCLAFDPIPTKFPVKPIIPKQRYSVLNTQEHYAEILCGINAIQASFDYFNLDDLEKKIEISFKLQPLISAFFYASPFDDQHKFFSYRMHLWNSLKERTTFLFLKDLKEINLDHYIQYLMNYKLPYIFHKDQYVKIKNNSFLDYMNGRLTEYPGKIPTVKDFRLLLKSIYFDVRVKDIIELRGCDNIPLPYIPMYLSLWEGLFYSDTIRDCVYEVSKTIDIDTSINWRIDFPKVGLGERKDIDLLLQIIGLAKSGLKERNKNDDHLIIMEELLKNKRFLADEIRRSYEELSPYSFINRWLY